MSAKGLDKPRSRSKIPEIPAHSVRFALLFEDPSGFMTSKSPTPPPSVDKKPPCKHPRVQIVSRDEDAEFVECLECGEIFDYSELKDMSIEERAQSSDI
jgi:hypothetical protein